MKVGLITFHFPHNFGAVFQCLALQTVIRKLGGQPEIIDYCPLYHTNRYATFTNPFVYVAEQRHKSSKGFELFLDFLRAIHSWVDFRDKRTTEKNFSYFCNRHFTKTKKFRKLKQMEQYSWDKELYISGSDQLWNIEMTKNQFDPAYFLTFAPNNTRKITFAVGADFTPEMIENSHAIQMLDELTEISVREKQTADLLCDFVSEKKIRVDLDPSLLLTAKDYESYISKDKLEEDNYILVYVIPNESQETVRKIAQTLAKKENTKIIQVIGNMDKRAYITEDLRLSSPDEFLWYIKNATMVVTNSFHGTAFSVIFQKQFVSVPHTKTGYRITELLEKVGLEKRYVSMGDAIDWSDLEQKIDYDLVSRLLEREKEYSINYLRKHIHGGKRECSKQK